MKTKLIKACKFLFILLLLLAISLVAFIQWKSDVIIEKVLNGLQAQLTDSLTYSDVDVSGFRYFPCLGIQLHDLHIGSGKAPLLSGVRVDVVVGLWPLLRDEVDIHSIHAYDADISIRYVNGKWSYDIMKKPERKVESAAATAAGWNTRIRKIELENCRLLYDDQQIALQLDAAHAVIDGEMSAAKTDAAIDFTGTVLSFKSGSYTLPTAMPVEFDGKYIQDASNKTQQLINWKLKHDGVDVALDGTITEQPDGEIMDIRGTWKDGDLQSLRSLVPASMMESMASYTFSGKSSGEFSYIGESSKSKSPVLEVKGEAKNAGFSHEELMSEPMSMDVVAAYHSDNPAHHNQSTLSLDLTNDGLLEGGFKGKIFMLNMDAPVYDIQLDGRCPASLVNLVTAPELSFSDGEFDIKSFALSDFRPSGKMLQMLFSQLQCEFRPDGVKGVYANNPVAIDGGYCKAKGDGRIEFAIDEMQWDKLGAKSVTGECSNSGETLEFIIGGKSCGGQIETKGHVTTTGQGHTFKADWRVKEIEMHTLLASFNNFDQTFITSDHLSGNADIWAETTVPMSIDWKVKSKEIVTRSAIVIKKGRLKNLKTLEDFSRYIHLEELRDIQFNELRNYLKIEDGKVYLPVMFIQSTAINLSIAGVHSFDQSILYNIKLNAGQAIGNKLKRTDFRKDIKPARKSGWINMYFVLEGTTSNVRYQQYRTAVVAGFEQSAALKEQLRNYMVDRFGYDVYWLEPNEWEDIPEYK